MWISLGLIGLFLVFGIVFFLGKGKCLIAGYNTASKEERARYNFRKLSYFMGIFCIGVAAMLVICLFTNYTWQIGVPGIFILIGFVLMSNRWCLADGVKPSKGSAVIMIIYLVFVCVISVFLYSGKTSFYMDEDGVILDATFAKQVAFYWEDIQKVELDTDFDIGYKAAGTNNARIEAGKYRNDVLGEYWLYADTNADAYIIFSTSRGTFVYGSKNTEQIQNYVEEIREAIAF